MEAGGADAAEVHAGPLADRLEALEDRDVFSCIGSHYFGKNSSDFSTPIRPRPARA
jgi:hypothetical protein